MSRAGAGAACPSTPSGSCSGAGVSPSAPGLRSWAAAAGGGGGRSRREWLLFFLLLLSFLAFYHLWGGCSGGEGWVCLGREWVVFFWFFSKKREVGKKGSAIEHENRVLSTYLPTYSLTYILTNLLSTDIRTDRTDTPNGLCVYNTSYLFVSSLPSFLPSSVPHLTFTLYPLLYTPTHKLKSVL